jgi:hypothetical protein
MAAPTISTHQTCYHSLEMTKTKLCTNEHLQIEQHVCHYVSQVCRQVYCGAHYGLGGDQMTFV